MGRDHLRIDLRRFPAAGRSRRSAEVTRAAGSQPTIRALAQTAGFQRGALVAAGFSIAAALVAGLMLRRAERAAASARPPEPAPEPALRAA